MSHGIVDDPLKLRARYQALKSARKTIEGSWQEIERYCLPYAGEFFTDYTSEHQIRTNRHEIYDSTAPNSVKRLAAFIHSGVTNPLDLWFDINFRDKNLNNGPAKEWLEDARDTVWQTLQESNFNLEINEVYLDLAAFGTGIMLEELVDPDVWEGVNFQATSLRNSYFEEDHRGQVLRYYQRMEWKLAQIIDKFGDKLPDSLKVREGGTADIDLKHEIFLVVYPRVANPHKESGQGPVAPKKRPWGFKYIVLATGEMIGEEGGYYEMPVTLARWGKIAGSQWGHSPCMVALPDIKTLNELVELDLRAREKAIDPAIAVTERGLIGDLDLGPGGLTVVRSMDDWQIIESGARFDATNDKMAQLQESVRNYLYIPDIRLKESPAMTATEVIERREDTQRVMGPAMGRLQSDMLDRVVSRTFNMLLRAGQLGDIPQGLEKAELDIAYMGPMARSLRNERVQAVETWMMLLERYAAVDPSVMENVVSDEFARGTSVMLGVPQKMVVDKEEMEAKREKQAEQQAAAAKAAQAQEAGAGMEAMGKGGVAVNQAANEGGQGADMMGAIAQDIVGGQQQ